VPEHALRFVLSPPEVSTVIVGMRSIGNVERNTAVSDGRPLRPDRRAVLARHRWERNFYLPA
jgi:aryl-alcohol dehydrogenase-like predicted oxidoreductase